MPRSFAITAVLNLQGPNNLKPIISQIQSAFQSVKANVDIKFGTTTTGNINTMTAAFNKFNTTLNQTTTSAYGAANALKALGTAVNQTSNLKTLNTTLTTTVAKTKAVAQATTTAHHEMQEFGRVAGLAVRRFAGFAIATNVIMGFIGQMKEGVSQALDFQHQIVRLSMLAHTTTAGMKPLGDEITRLSKTLGVSSKELLSISDTLIQAGLSASDTKVALEALAKTALAPAFEDIKMTTDGVVAAMAQFKLKASELEGALGSMHAVAAKFAVESTDIIKAIRIAGGSFATLSQGVVTGQEALNQFMAVFTSIRGTTRESAESIATGLRTILTRLERPETLDMLKQLGIELLDLKGMFVGPYEAINRISTVMKEINVLDPRFMKIGEALGGYRQINKVIPMLMQAQMRLEALKTAQEGQSALNEVVAKSSESWQVQMGKANERFLALVRTISQSDSFKHLMTMIIGLTNAFVRFGEALAPVLPYLGLIMGMKAIATVRPILMQGFPAGLKGRAGPMKMAGGGLVPGYGDGDTVPARLTPGEFVVRKKAVQAIGAENLVRANQYSNGGGVQNFKIGGFAIKIGGHKYTNRPNSRALKLQGMTPEQIQQHQEKWDEGFAIHTGKRPTQTVGSLSMFGGETPTKDTKYYSVKSNFASAIDSMAAHLVNSTSGMSPVNIEAVFNNRINRFVRALANKTNLGGTNYSIPISNLSSVTKMLSTGRQPDNINQVVAGNIFETIISRLIGFNSGRADNRGLDIHTTISKKALSFLLPHLSKSDLNFASNLSLWDIGRSPRSEAKMISKFQTHLAGRASGGSVDSVPAMLTPGEFVINKGAASRIGLPTLHSLNNADKVRGFQHGGTVPADINAIARQGAMRTLPTGTMLSGTMIQQETNRLISEMMKMRMGWQAAGASTRELEIRTKIFGRALLKGSTEVEAITLASRKLVGFGGPGGKGLQLGSRLKGAVSNFGTMGAFMGSMALSQMAPEDKWIQGISGAMASGATGAMFGNVLGGLGGKKVGLAGGIGGGIGGALFGLVQGIQDTQVRNQATIAQASLTNSTKALDKAFAEFEKTGNIENAKKMFESFSKQMPTQIATEYNRTLEFGESAKGTATLLDLQKQGVLANTGTMPWNWNDPKALHSGKIAGMTRYKASVSAEDNARINIITAQLKRNIPLTDILSKKNMTDKEYQKVVLSGLDTEESTEYVDLRRKKFAKGLNSVEQTRLKILTSRGIAQLQGIEEEIKMSQKIALSMRLADVALLNLTNALDKFSASLKTVDDIGAEFRQSTQDMLARAGGSVAISNVQRANLFENPQAYSGVQLANFSEGIISSFGVKPNEGSKLSKNLAHIRQIGGLREDLLRLEAQGAGLDIGDKPKDILIKMVANMEPILKGRLEEEIKGFFAGTGESLSMVDFINTGGFKKIDAILQKIVKESLTPMADLLKVQESLQENYIVSLNQRAERQKQINETMASMAQIGEEQKIQLQGILNPNRQIMAEEAFAPTKARFEAMGTQAGVGAGDAFNVDVIKNKILSTQQAIKDKRAEIIAKPNDMNLFQKNQKDISKLVVEQSASRVLLDAIHKDTSRQAGIMDELRSIERKRDAAGKTILDIATMNPQEIAEKSRQVRAFLVAQQNGMPADLPGRRDVIAGGRFLGGAGGPEMAANIDRQLINAVIDLVRIQTGYIAQEEGLGLAGMKPGQDVRGGQLVGQFNAAGARGQEAGQAIVDLGKADIQFMVDNADIVVRGQLNFVAAQIEKLNVGTRWLSGGAGPNAEGMAFGGRIGGAVSDTVPALLTPGEFVVRREAAQANLGLLQGINAMGFAKGGKVTLEDIEKMVTNQTPVGNVQKPVGDLEKIVQSIPVLPDSRKVQLLKQREAKQKQYQTMMAGRRAQYEGAHPYIKQRQQLPEKLPWSRRRSVTLPSSGVGTYEQARMLNRDAKNVPKGFIGFWDKEGKLIQSRYIRPKSKTVEKPVYTPGPEVVASIQQEKESKQKWSNIMVQREERNQLRDREAKESRAQINTMMNTSPIIPVKPISPMVSVSATTTYTPASRYVQQAKNQELKNQKEIAAMQKSTTEYWSTRGGPEAQRLNEDRKWGRGRGTYSPILDKYFAQGGLVRGYAAGGSVAPGGGMDFTSFERLASALDNFAKINIPQNITVSVAPIEHTHTVMGEGALATAIVSAITDKINEIVGGQIRGIINPETGETSSYGPGGPLGGK